jgi:hypothetical protein
MLDRNEMRDLERELGFLYPPSFVLRIEELNALSKTSRFAQVMPRARLLTSKADAQMAREHSLPSGFIPFLAEQQSAHVDYYAFDTLTNSPDFPVLVFADHAVVKDWDDFDTFYAWLMAKVIAAESVSLY